MNDIAKKKFESLFPDGEMEPQECLQLCNMYMSSLLSTNINAIWHMLDEMPLSAGEKTERWLKTIELFKQDNHNIIDKLVEAKESFTPST